MGRPSAVRTAPSAAFGHNRAYRKLEASMLARACYALKRLPYMSFDLTAASVGAVFVTGIAWVVIATCASTLLRERRAPVSDLPCNVIREGG